MFTTAPAELDKPIILSLKQGSMPGGITTPLPVGRWRWVVVPSKALLDPAAGGWLAITTDQPFNSKRRGYSPDLALLVGYVGVLP